MAVEASENHIRRLTAIANDDEDIITLMQGRTDSQRYYWVRLAQSEALWLTFQNHGFGYWMEWNVQDESWVFQYSVGIIRRWSGETGHKISPSYTACKAISNCVILPTMMERVWKAVQNFNFSINVFRKICSRYMRKRKQFYTFGLSKHVIIKSLFTSELANLIYFRKKSDNVFFMMISWMSVQSHKQKMDRFERDKAENGMPVPLSLRLLPWYSATLFWATI